MHGNSALHFCNREVRAGAMYACQIYQAAVKDLPTLDEDIAAGKFAPLRTWLNEKVHKARARCCRLAVSKLRRVITKRYYTR